MSDWSDTLHACCVLIGEAGILIRGPSGAGKSTLARALVDLAGRDGFAALVADDTVRVSRYGDTLVARPHPRTGGLWEVRGLGILPVDHESAARLVLVVDCGPQALDRLPDPTDRVAEIGGVTLHRVVAGPRQADRVMLALRLAGNPIAPDAL